MASAWLWHQSLLERQDTRTQEYSYMASASLQAAPAAQGRITDELAASKPAVMWGERCHSSHGGTFLRMFNENMM